MAKKKQDLTAAKVRELSSEELSATIRTVRDQLYRLRAQTVTEKVEDTSQFRALRRGVARLMSEQTRRGGTRQQKREQMRTTA